MSSAWIFSVVKNKREPIYKADNQSNAYPVVKQRNPFDELPISIRGSEKVNKVYPC